MPGEDGGDELIPSHPCPLLTLMSPLTQNGGMCQDDESGTYVCRCPHGFTGSNCEYSQALHCHPGRRHHSLHGNVIPGSLQDGCSWFLTLQRRVVLMPPVSTGWMGRAIPAAVTWARLGRGAPRVSDTGIPLAPSWDMGIGWGPPMEIGTWLGPPW